MSDRAAEHTAVPKSIQDYRHFRDAHQFPLATCPSIDGAQSAYVKVMKILSQLQKHSECEVAKDHARDAEYHIDRVDLEPLRADNTSLRELGEGWYEIATGLAVEFDDHLAAHDSLLAANARLREALVAADLFIGCKMPLTGQAVMEKQTLQQKIRSALAEKEGSV